jgi:hypothetical protein
MTSRQVRPLQVAGALFLLLACQHQPDPALSQGKSTSADTRLAQSSSGALPRLEEASVLADSLAAHLGPIHSRDILDRYMNRLLSDSGKAHAAASPTDSSAPAPSFPSQYFRYYFHSNPSEVTRYLSDSAARRVQPFNLCYPTAHLKQIADSLQVLPRSASIDGPLSRYTELLGRVAWTADTILERTGSCFSVLTPAHEGGWVWRVAVQSRYASLPRPSATVEAATITRLRLLLDTLHVAHQRMVSTLAAVR